MFCLMDVSGSMSEHMKDLAKRFYMLLYVFLKRRYRHVEIVFIRHTDRAEEVDEETFFHGPASGGTLVSSALQAMHEIVRSRFRPADWNIYAAQASDGDNSHSDDAAVSRLLTEMILPVSQFFAYLEVGEAGGSTFDMLGFVALDAVPAPARRRRAAVDAQGQRPQRNISGVSRSVSPPPQAGESRAMTATHRATVRGSGLGFPDAAAHPRRLRGDRAIRTRARHLSQPDRGHHRRADAGRLFLGRHAAVLQALVVRQAFRPSGGVLPQGADGPRL